MEKYLKRIPAFDDIVFEFRNKEYGAYLLRQRYNNTLFVALLISTIITGTAIIAPYLNSKASENREKLNERKVEIKPENFDQPNQQVAPPPLPGKVVVKFCVTSKGGVDLVSIYKGVDPQLDAEAIRVVKSLPLFKPGKQGGKPVPVWFSVPITFQIK